MFAHFLYKCVPNLLLLASCMLGCLICDDREVIAEIVIDKICWVKKKEKRKGKNNFQNWCIAIVLLRL